MSEKNVRNKATGQALHLLCLLSDKKCTRLEIIEEFRKHNCFISKTTVSNYIAKLIQCNIPIAFEKIGKTKKYYINKKKIYTDFHTYEVSISQEMKNLLICEKCYQNIRMAIAIYYKFALKTKDQFKRKQLADFGYFSKINWKIVNELEEHCEQKNIIKVEYLLPKGGFMDIKIHADRLKIGDWTNRLYLTGVFEGAQKFSNLPVDRIYMVKDIVKKNVRFDLETEILTYKVTKHAFENSPYQRGEVVFGTDEGLLVVDRPLDDDFNIVQRLLHFCPDLYYISDKRIKKMVEEKLYILKESYNAT